MLALSVTLSLFWQLSRPLSPVQAIAPLIAEARAITQSEGDTIWPGFSRTPFPVLFVGQDTSVLFCPDGPATGFTSLGVEPQTQCRLKSRPRQLATDSKATWPAVDGRSTVVIGAPRLTEGNETAWISTLLHEHFHQLQASQPQYINHRKTLELASSDNTRTKVLDLPFPYGDPEVARRFALMGLMLARALSATEDNHFQRLVLSYRQVRREAFAHLNSNETRYAEFLLWQEGVARYSEIALAEAAIEHAKRSRSPYDYSALAINLRTRVRRNLEHLDMTKNRRISFYALGAGEALLLDRLRPDWRNDYFDTGFALGPLLGKNNSRDKL